MPACARYMHTHTQTYTDTHTHTNAHTYEHTHTQQTEYSKYPDGSSSKSNTLSGGKLRLFFLILVFQVKPYPSHILAVHRLTAGLLPTSQADTYLIHNPCPF